MVSKTSNRAETGLQDVLDEGHAFVSKQKIYRLNAAALGRTVSEQIVEDGYHRLERKILLHAGALTLCLVAGGAIYARAAGIGPREIEHAFKDVAQTVSSHLNHMTAPRPEAPCPTKEIGNACVPAHD